MVQDNQQVLKISHWRQLKALTFKAISIQRRLSVGTISQYLMSFLSFIGSAAVFGVSFINTSKKDGSLFTTDLRLIFILVMSLPYISLTKNIFQQIILDKETKMIEILKFNNLSPITYGLSFITQHITFVIYTAMSVIAQIIIIHIIQPNSDTCVEQRPWQFIGLFFNLILFAFALICFSLFVSIFFHNSKLGQLIGSQIFLLPVMTFTFLYNTSLNDNDLSLSQFLVFIPHYPSFLYIFDLTGCFNLVATGKDQDAQVDLHLTSKLSFLFLIFDILLYFGLYVYFSDFSKKRKLVKSDSSKNSKVIQEQNQNKSSVDQENLLSEDQNVITQTYSSKKIAIEITNLSMKFDDFYAIKNLDLVVNQNELICLIGPNGSGKSTLLNMISGLLKQTTGSIKIYGEELNKENKRWLLDFCLQEDTLIDNYTIEEHLKIICDLKNIPEGEMKQNVEDVLKTLNLYEHRDKFSQDLSLGTKRKLQMGMSLLGSKSILILDEITSGLDIESRRQIWELIKDLKDKTGKTIIFCTQHLQEAEELADKILLLKEGEIKYFGEPDKLLNNMQDNYLVTLKTKTADTGFIDFKQAQFELQSNQELQIQTTNQRIQNQVTYKFKKQDMETILPMLNNLQNEYQGIQIDMSISNLEENYMKFLYEEDELQKKLTQLQDQIYQRKFYIGFDFQQTKIQVYELLKIRYKLFKRDKMILFISIVTMVLALITLFAKLAPKSKQSDDTYKCLPDIDFKESFIKAFCYGHASISGLLILQISLDQESKFRYLMNLGGLKPQIYWLTNLVFDVGIYCCFGIFFLLVLWAKFGAFVGDYFLFPILIIGFGFQLVLLMYMVAINMKNSNAAFATSIAFTMGLSVILPIASQFLTASNLISQSGGFYQQTQMMNIVLVLLGFDPFVGIQGAIETQIGYQEFKRSVSHVQGNCSLNKMRGIISIFDLVCTPVITLMFCVLFYKLVTHVDQMKLNQHRKIYKKKFILDLFPNTQYMIQIKNLKKHYKKDKPILDDLDLDVKNGQILGLLGPNGCGKSTLLNILSLELKRNDGQIIILGSYIDEFSPMIQGLDLGYCSQYNILRQKLKVEEHLNFISVIKGMTPEQIKQKKEWLMEALDLKRYGDKRAETLSEGNKRKLCLAMSLMRQPKLLILDEPFTGVDPLGKRQIYQVLKSLKDITIVLSTHSIEEAEALCDRIVIMQQGKFQEDLTVTELSKRNERLYRIKLVLQDQLMAAQVEEELKTLKDFKYVKDAEYLNNDMHHVLILREQNDNQKNSENETIIEDQAAFGVDEPNPYQSQQIDQTQSLVSEFEDNSMQVLKVSDDSQVQITSTHNILEAMMKLEDLKKAKEIIDYKVYKSSFEEVFSYVQKAKSSVRKINIQ
eukprot:403352264